MPSPRKTTLAAALAAHGWETISTGGGCGALYKTGERGSLGKRRESCWTITDGDVLAPTSLRQRCVLFYFPDGEYLSNGEGTAWREYAHVHQALSFVAKGGEAAFDHGMPTGWSEV